MWLGRRVRPETVLPPPSSAWGRKDGKRYEKAHHDRSALRRAAALGLRGRGAAAHEAGVGTGTAHRGARSRA